MDKRSIREIFTDAAGMAAALTCAVVATPFLRPMISGFSDTDLANLADMLRATPLVFLSSAFVAGVGRCGIELWKATHPQKPDAPNLR